MLSEERGCPAGRWGREKDTSVCAAGRGPRPSARLPHPDFPRDWHGALPTALRKHKLLAPAPTLPQRLHSLLVVSFCVPGSFTCKRPQLNTRPSG